jgi:hypothetical protein
LIIPTLLAAENRKEASSLLRNLPLDHLAPFRLFLFHAEEHGITSLSSDGLALEEAELPWEQSHWFSSGYDEPEAVRIRGMSAKRAESQSDAGTLDWLRRLHRSHDPEEGPFSICMHREDACSVSMTEISFLNQRAGLTYHEGTPCLESDGLRLTLP